MNTKAHTIRLQKTPSQLRLEKKYGKEKLYKNILISALFEDVFKA